MVYISNLQLYLVESCYKQISSHYDSRIVQGTNEIYHLCSTYHKVKSNSKVSNIITVLRLRLWIFASICLKFCNSSLGREYCCCLNLSKVQVRRPL